MDCCIFLNFCNSSKFDEFLHLFLFSLKDPNAEFRSMGRLVFERKRHKNSIMIFMQIFQKLSRFLKLKLTLQEVEDFFIESVRETVRYREENDVTRNDFMDLLIKIKNGKSLNDSDGETLSGLSLNEMAAHIFVFFLAGFETSSTNMMFALYELALNKDIQNRARDEIKQVLERHGGEMTYEAVMDMTYLTQIFNGKSHCKKSYSASKHYFSHNLRPCKTCSYNVDRF